MDAAEPRGDVLGALLQLLPAAAADVFGFLPPPPWAAQLLLASVVRRVLVLAAAVLVELGDAGALDAADASDLAALWADAFGRMQGADPRSAPDDTAVQEELARAVAVAVHAGRRQARRRAQLLAQGPPPGPAMPECLRERSKTILLSDAFWAAAAPPAAALERQRAWQAKSRRRLGPRASSAAPSDEDFPAAYV